MIIFHFFWKTFPTLLSIQFLVNIPQNIFQACNISSMDTLTLCDKYGLSDHYKHGVCENVTLHVKNLLYIFHFLECKEGRLELVFGGNFWQLHKFLPTTTFLTVQVHSTRLELSRTWKKPKKKKVTCECDDLTKTMFTIPIFHLSSSKPSYSQTHVLQHYVFFFFNVCN